LWGREQNSGETEREESVRDRALLKMRDGVGYKLITGENIYGRCERSETIKMTANGCFPRLRIFSVLLLVTFCLTDKSQTLYSSIFKEIIRTQKHSQLV
jgi:hypothetical protein